MKRVAFVIPWFGADQKGGAERQAWQVATRLAARSHPVDVLTTCSRSFFDDWGANHVDEGVSIEAGLTIRRFPVAARNRAAFETANREFLDANGREKAAGVCPVTEKAAAAFVNENIHAPGLYDYLAQSGARYSAIVFMPYLYGPTLRGLPVVRDRAYLQPCLHDETYAYLPAVEAVFHAAHRLLFNSEGEADLAAHLYGPSVWAKGVCVGEGVEVDGGNIAGDGDRVRDRILEIASSGRPYVVSMGRRDPTKNTDLLLRAYARFRRQHPAAELDLVIAGPGDLPRVPGDLGGVIDIGYVSEAEKALLLERCAALVQPSQNESYSRAMMEAWCKARPVVAHRHCRATARAVDACAGGFLAGDEGEWSDTLALIAASTDADLTERGRRGEAYARDNADWSRVIARYEDVLGLREPTAPARRHSTRRVQAVHQVLADLAPGDAISNHAIFLRDTLTSLGFESHIFVRNLNLRNFPFASVYQPGDLPRGAAVIYHHSIGSDLTTVAMSHAGPKALIYHNITPSAFFHPWNPSQAHLLDQGRAELHALAGAFPLSAGVSQQNADELRGAGFTNPHVLRIAVDPAHWDHPADPTLMAHLQDGRTNILFVGRIAPNKCQHDLVTAFQTFARFDPTARLVLVGKALSGDPYAAHVRDAIARSPRRDRIVAIERATPAELQACYRTAHLFWSMSEHEGFCVPLVEAMWFDVPVFAFRAAAIPETLGPAGILFREKRGPEVAALAHLLTSDDRLRRTVLHAQRRRRLDFLPSQTFAGLFQLLASMGVRVASVAAGSPS